MFAFWRTKNLISEIDCEWIFATFASSLAHFDHQEFFHRSQLIQPTDAYFPGQINDPKTMANTVFKATLKHCGLQHWPFQLQHMPTHQQQPLPMLTKNGYLLKRHSTTALPSLDNASTIDIYYNPQQTTQPSDLAASFSHLLAQHLLLQSQLTPIGGDELFAQHTELLAVMMGFGVMISNSAYAFRGSCSRCFNPQAHRKASLSEDKVVFALALFCQLKEIPYKQATKHLKPYLRPLYKQAIKQINDHPEKLSALLSLNNAIETQTA